MLSEEQLNALPERIAQRLQQINEEFLKTVGKRIKEIGKMTPSDAHKFLQLRSYGADMDEIIKKLAELSDRSAEEIHRIYQTVAKGNYAFAKEVSAAKDMPYIPYQENKQLQQFVRAMANQTANTYRNMSRDTAFRVVGKDGRITLTTLAKAYDDAIDKAVTAVATGVLDYQSAMRSVLKQFADSGIRTKYTPKTGVAGKSVDYASGYSRRLDTAVRQNILYGVKECNQTVAEQVGEAFGADGWEISLHANPRPSHEKMGGKQYAAGKARTIHGVYYPSISTVEHLLSDYGCLHFKFPIVLGVSEPTYSAAEIEEMRRAAHRQIEFEGKTYTPYEAQQVQRKLETAIRHAKDRQIIAKAANDDTLRREEQALINQLTNKYADFSKAAGLSVKKERMSVSGYRKVKAQYPKVTAAQKEPNSSLKKQEKGDIIIKEKPFRKFKSGKEVNQYFGGRGTLLERKKSVEKQWIKHLSDDQRKAVSSYCADGYGDLNTYLRQMEGSKYIDANRCKEIVKDLDAAIEKFELKDNIIVYRGVDKNYLNTLDLDHLVGTVLEDKGYMSASPIHVDIVDRRDAIFEIKVPAGKGKGAYVNALSGFQDEEYEFLLKRGTKCSVTSVDQTGEKPVIKMEVIE